MTSISRFRLALVTVFGLCLPGAASAAPIVLDGETTKDGGDFLYLPFTVPDGTTEIEVRHDDLSSANILDFGLDDPSGWRGWGGDLSEPSIVGLDAASRCYTPGPIMAGTWNVVIGKAKIKESPAKYHVEIDLRTTPTLPKQSYRKPYVPAVLDSTARWYAGDFHVHSRESGDAKPTIDEITAFAKSRGLDFVELSDHNTISQVDQIVDAQAKTKVLLIPGFEYTTYAGHANGIGGTKWVNHRIGDKGANILDAIKAIHAQGALFSINHPGLDLGDQCIGCAWKHDVPPEMVDAVEIETTAYKPTGFLFHSLAIQFWEELLDKGSHAAAVGGSDDHKGGAEFMSTQQGIASPTTMVFARELSASAIQEAIKNGRTVVKLQGPEDPMVDFTTDVAPNGDTVSDEFVLLRAKVTGGGDSVRFVKNGTPLEEIEIHGDYVHELVVDAPKSGVDRYRAEVLVEGQPRTISSHVFVKFAATGRARPSTAAEPESKGCSCGVPGTTRAASVAGVGLLVAALLSRRRRSGNADDH
ncbi:MAG: CehA/McbA family metallohydrolase [Polyangiales bacterium]